MATFFFVAALCLVAATASSLVQAGCTRPSIFSNVLSSFPPGFDRRSSSFDQGKIISFQCTPDYDYDSGDKVIVCYESEWFAVSKRKMDPYTPFRCKAAKCLQPTIEDGYTKVKGHWVHYFCNRGFELRTLPSKSRCHRNETGHYVPIHVHPKCQPLVTCVEPSSLGLQHEGECCFVGDKVSLSCPPDHRLEGDDSNVTCTKDGIWNPTLPVCKRIARCPDPGNSTYGLRQGTTCCEVGSRLRFTCNAGYELVDPKAGDSITCLETEEWSARRPRCKRKGSVTCPDIPTEKNHLEILHEAYLSDVYHPSDQVDLECKEDYITSSKSQSLVCEDSGQWDADFPVCEPKNPCRRPPMPKNGRIKELAADTTRLVYPIGFEFNIVCDPLHEIRSGHYGTRCSGTDTWEPEIANCTLVECIDPGVPEGAERIGSDFQVGRSVKYICKQGLTLLGSETRTCQENRRWSGTTTVCNAGDTDCPDPGEPIHSYRTRTVGGFKKGDVVTYTCAKGYEMLTNDTRVCMPDRTWSNEEIVCLGPNEYSDVDDVSSTISEVVTRAARESDGRSRGSSGGAYYYYFLLDTSGSITDEQFKKSKEFIKFFIRQVTISQSDIGIHMVAINFSRTATTALPMTVRSTEEAIKLVNGIKKFRNTGTNIEEALKRLRAEVLTAEKYSKVISKMVAFILTDGKKNEGASPAMAAEAVRKRKVDLIAIAIGNDRNTATLKEITGDNNKIIALESHEKLYEIISLIANRTDYSLCGLEQPKFSRPGYGSQNSEGKIVGGKKSSYVWPWVAALYYKNENGEWEAKCGGSIIHSEWILSAAHCFTEVYVGTIQEGATKRLRKVDRWKVSVGRINLTETDSGVEYFVIDIKVHWNFQVNWNAYYNDDVALVRVNRPITYDLYTRPICLPPPVNELRRESNLYSSGEMAVVIGWGHTEVIQPGDPTNVTDHLREVIVPLQNDTICQIPPANTEKRMGSNSLCAGFPKGGKDSCKGDSGGPLMRFVSTNSSRSNVVMNRWVVVGTVSWGIGCGLPNHYGYYVHVAKLMPWILNKTGEAEFEYVTLLQ